MFTYRRLIKLSCFLALAGLALAACQAQTPTPERVQEKIIKTVVVTEIVEREGEKVIETIIVTVEPKAGVEEPAEQGPRTLVICMGSEPNSLYVYESGMASSSAIRQAIYDGPFDNNSFAYQPVILEKLPNLADGDAVLQTVSVSVGEKITDSSGEVAELAEGMLVKTAGCTSMDCAVEYEDGELLMDQLVVTFKLLPDITWSDGTPLTAHDSVFSFAKYMGPGNTSGRYWGERTSSYEALDDLTVVWTGLPGFLDATYYTSFWDPLPEHVLGQYTDAELEEAEDANRLPLGWGAYIIDEWVQGDRITLHKNPTYWRADEGLPKFDRLVFRFVGQNSNANIASLLAGECDIVLSQLDDQSKLLLELDDASQLNAYFVPGTVWEHADFNIQPLGEGYFAAWDTDGDGLGPFGDVRLRQSVAMCFDRQAVVDTVMFGQSEVVHTYLPSMHPLFNPDVKQWTFDVAAGSALLEEIGWVDDDGDTLTPRIASGVKGVPDGTPLEFNYETTNSVQRQQATQILAESAAQCGIKMNQGYHPASVWFDNGPEGVLFGRRFDLGQFAWLTGVPSPCDLYLGGTNIPSVENEWWGYNETGWDNPEYNAICNSALGTLPGQKGYEQYNLEAQYIFAQELPAVPLYLRLRLAATRTDMCNFSVDPTGISFTDIEEYDYGECAE